MLKKLIIALFIVIFLAWCRSRIPASIMTLSTLNPVTLRDQKLSTGSQGTSIRQIVGMLKNKTFTQPTTLSWGSDAQKTALPGIQVNTKDSTVVIVSRGYAFSDHTPSADKQNFFTQFPRTGGGFICASNWVKYLGITVPTISFDYLDSWNNFDFGLNSDKKALTLVVDEVIKQNPTVQIILIGSCKGSRSILNYMADKPASNIKAILLDAPFESAQEVCKAIHKNYCSWLPYGDSVLYCLMRAWFPRYNPDQDLPNTIHALPQDIPILIGHLKNDVLVCDDQIKQFVAQFNNPENLYLCTVSHPTITHSKLSHMVAFQQVANSFLQEYDLPHDEQKARCGKTWLAIARRNPKHLDSLITIKSH